MEKRRFPTHRVGPTQATQSAGLYRFSLERRNVGADGGLTIHVFGPRNQADEELLRFDCFRNNPHYHLGVSYRDDPPIEIDDPDPFAWSLEQLARSFGTLLQDAGADVADRGDWEGGLPGVLKRLEHDGRALAAQ